jgi:hypothetical protein
VTPDVTELGGDFQISSHGADGATDVNPREPDVTYSPFTNEYVAIWEADIHDGADEESEIFSRRIASGDTIDPLLALVASKTAKARDRAVRLKLNCNETCLLTARASVTGLAKSFKLKTVQRPLPTGGDAELVLRIPKSRLAAILARLRAKRKVLVKIAVTAVDAHGNDTVSTKTVRLK